MTGRARGLALNLAGLAAKVDPALGRRLGPVAAVLYTHPDLIDLDAYLAWLYPDPKENDHA